MPNLGYATTGPGALYNAIGWFNFISLPASFTTPYTATLTNSIKGGGSIQATFTMTRIGGAGSSTFSRVVPPTWAQAAFGNTAYLGITLPVCLRDTLDVSPISGKIVVNNINIMNKYGQNITNYNFYFTDSETPGATDVETFITNGSPWSIFYTLPNTGQGFTNLAGVGTQTITTNGLGNAPILLTTNPTSITQTVQGGGAMSFGLSLTIAELSKVITNRISPNDQFQINITGPNSGTTITAGSSTGVQAQGLQIISGSGGQSVFTFNESMAPGSSSPLSYYTQTVQVSNLTTGGTTLPSTINLGSNLTLNLGDYALVTITNAPITTSITLNKTVDKQYATIGDTLTYTISVINNTVYPLNNVTILDTIPVNTQFVSNSLTVDGTSVIGSPAPPTGVTVGTLAFGQISTVTFKVIVTTIPTSGNVVNNSTATFNPNFSLGPVTSKAIITTVNIAQLNSSKQVNNYAGVGDVLTYTIPLINIGTITAENIFFIDTIPNDTTLVANSFKQDSTTISGSPNPPGITLPNSIGGFKVSTITFKVTINTIPSPNPILNSASASYTFNIDTSTTPSRTGRNSTNTPTVFTQINIAKLSNISKSVDKNYAKCGDILTYTILIPNSGNTSATNVVFLDTIPSGTSLIPNTVVVNGVTQPIGTSPQTGINIGTISAGATSTVTFQVVVIC